MTAVRETPEGVELSVRVAPRASKNELCGMHGDALRVRLQAPPVDGKANKALVRLLARTFDVPPSSVRILRGETGRLKRVLVRGGRASAIAGIAGTAG